MKTSLTIAVIAAAVSIAPAFAKKAANKAPEATLPAKWEKEPDGFLGIKFGEIMPMTVSDCPRNGAYVDFARLKQLDSICFDGDRKNYGRLWNTPDLGFPYQMAVMLDSGVPVSFTITTDPKYFASLAKVLVQRYGSPTRQADSTVQSQGGAEFENQTLSWVGPHVTIKADMRSGQVDTSETYISDHVYWQKKQADQDSAAARGSSQL
jgi:hypothetical protein